ncbi:hypothetical protein B0H10DRAFT_387340 [Mycena sp. CBHHK59/15]|nr:hypothetical protein B0H10DRAFT_387340 [Mycena sp. CBHHK59/15]
MFVPATHFVLAFPLVVDSVFYGGYAVLFFLSVHVLCTRRKVMHNFHLACMILLFALSTTHIVLAYVLAFVSDYGVSAPYEIFSLRSQAPALFPEGDPSGTLNRMAESFRVLYGISNAVADAIILFRCYVIWSRNWKIIVLPAIGWLCSILSLSWLAMDELPSSSLQRVRCSPTSSLLH